MKKTVKRSELWPQAVGLKRVTDLRMISDAAMKVGGLGESDEFPTYK